MDILIAALIVAGVALALGIMLAVVSHFFFVPENPVQQKIRACLPSINCGACGYKGCDDYAAALAAGDAPPNLCIPGAQIAADEISSILGVTAEPLEDVVAFVACNGHCDATHTKADYHGLQTCKAASMLYGGEGSCTYGCLGLGDCAVACPADAICTIDGIAHVDTSRCLGCGLCARTCPKGIIYMVPQNTTQVVMCSNKDKGADARKACVNACIGCKKCEKTCPHGAIQVANNLAFFIYSKCTGCGACVEVCPTGCLKTVFFPDLPEGTEAEDLLDLPYDHTNP
ncbi:MAG: RnfABCDGE type electron transport complex subunit B [Clostridia bacterium]|nr:RnfABCDGE type electron transport complex subunit B [Clostridia bacterium]